ncbi:unnamed protein product [Mycena citricolor]|uniref:Uncharacterized protein n=1 Tax=Mycena citricolor TaxID=2018698 RepID=A0AAD2HUX9_9AGAR|nr:unnamed protein product [Mycena citricolor]
MARSLSEVFFGGTTFCCCLRVRLGVMVMTVLGMLFSGLFSVLLWFELSSSKGLSSSERTILILAGLVETLLFVFSILGFVGAVVRKQLFVQIYAYFTYFHVLVNFGVAAFLLYTIVHGSHSDVVAACQTALLSSGTQAQCTGIFRVGIDIYAVVAGVVLSFELYGALIVTRYLNQIKREKRDVRASRVRQSGFKMGSGARYATIKDDDYDHIPLQSGRPPSFHAAARDDFDPYQEVQGPDYRHTAYDGMPGHDFNDAEHERDISAGRLP